MKKRVDSMTWQPNGIGYAVTLLSLIVIWLIARYFLEQFTPHWRSLGVAFAVASFAVVPRIINSVITSIYDNKART
jgi:hypothetical protein